MSRQTLFKLIATKVTLAFFLLFSLVLVGCQPKVTKQPPPIDESAVAAEYIEKEITFEKLMGNVFDSIDLLVELEDRPANIIVLDLRSPEAYAAGHIAGAVNLELNKLISYYRDNNLEKLKHVVLTSDSGQLARYAQGLMRMAGYDNVFLHKWGMSGWNTAIAKQFWLAKISNEFTNRFSQQETPRNPMGEMPKLNTNKHTPREILRARVETILATENVFENSLVQPAELFANPENYYIVNYWPKNLYLKGHIPGAVQYTIKPESDLGYSKALKTLPTNKTVAIYCFTGQTSALMTGYLQVLGYDARSVAYGVNAMNHNMLPANKFTEKTPKNFPLVK